MVIWVMKTTVEISDSLFKKLKQTALQRGVTMREIIEEGLRLAINGKPKNAYKLPDLSRDMGGLVDPNMTQEQMWEIVYGDRY